MMIVMEYAAGGTLQNYLLSKVNKIRWRVCSVRYQEQLFQGTLSFYLV